MEQRAEIEEIIKITITKEAGERLMDILTKVNEGFDAGKVTRQDIASWIIERFQKSFGESEVQLIRKEFFNEKCLLGAILKKAKTTGDVPDFLREALRKHWNGALGSPEALSQVNRRSAKNRSGEKVSHLRNQSNQTIGEENGKSSL